MTGYEAAFADNQAGPRLLLAPVRDQPWNKRREFLFLAKSCRNRDGVVPSFPAGKKTNMMAVFF